MQIKQLIKMHLKRVQSESKRIYFWSESTQKIIIKKRSSIQQKSLNTISFKNSPFDNEGMQCWFVLFSWLEITIQTHKTRTNTASPTEQLQNIRATWIQLHVSCCVLTLNKVKDMSSGFAPQTQVCGHKQVCLAQNVAL